MDEKADVVAEVSPEGLVSHPKRSSKRTVGFVKAVNEANLTVREGETIGVVGEWSGKSTLALALMRLIKYEGSVYFNGQNLNEFSLKTLEN